ncbi:MAG TPA: hypothetical protein VHS59_07090 [Bacillota bacterium]|nr:hypothetical protein [Bacillota bacterium]
MATNMFVTGIPNGTSLDIQKGTALNLLKLLVNAAEQGDSKGGKTFDLHRIDQLAGCLGIKTEEAIKMCERVQKDEAPEQVINEHIEEREALKEDTIRSIQEKLQAIRG